MKKPTCFATIILTICILAFLSGCAQAIPRPTGLAVDDKDQLSWSEVEGARSYTVEIKSVESGKVNNYTVRKLTYSLSSLEEGDYKIRVKAVAGDTSKNKDSEWSQTLDFHKERVSGLVYTLINGNTEYEITKVGSAVGDVIIEDIYRGKPVTKIANNAFKGNAKVNNITIMGNRLKSIGDSAFYNCSRLVSINIPDSVTYIGSSAFQACRSLKTIKIPDAVTAIYDYTFHHSKGLESVEIGSGVKTIGVSAFSNCTSLTSITIPDSVTSIAEYAFDSCTLLKTVTIGSSVVNLDTGAFIKCAALEEVNFSNAGNLKTIADGAFMDCTSLKTIALPSGLERLGSYGLNGCTSLESVTIPDTMTSIGQLALNKTLVYQNSVQQHDGFAYAGNWLVGIVDELKTAITALTPATFKQGTAGIAERVFQNCSKLETIQFPTTLRYISDYAFYKNSMLYRVVIPENSVVSIGSSAFRDCAILSNIRMYEGIKTIGSYAFRGCSMLNNSSDFSIIPESVVSIGAYAFAATLLEKNPDTTGGVIYAGNWVVGFEAGVVNVVIREGTIGIADQAFFRCDTLTNLTGAGIANVKYIGIGAFYKCTKLSTINLGFNLKRIEDYTFYDCTSLFNVTFPLNLEYIGMRAFYKCELLSDINLADTLVETIGEYAFYGALNIKTIDFGTTVKSIGDYAFYKNSALTELIIPDNIEVIGKRAFSRSESLETVHIGSGLAVIDEYLFNGCISLKEVIIPSTVKAVRRSAFYNCSAVERLSLTEGLEEIGDYAFYGFAGITSLVIPQSVKSIGNYAFKGCTSLLSLYIDSTIATVGNHTFYGCLQATVYFGGSEVPEDWGRWNSSHRPVVFNSTLNAQREYVSSIIVSKDTILNANAKGGISAPQRDGYICVGWSTTAAGSVEYSVEGIATIDEATTLYPVWNVYVPPVDQEEPVE